MAADAPKLKILLPNQRPISSSSSSPPVDRFFLSGSSNSSVLGSSSMVSFEDVHAGKRSSRLFFSSIDQEDIGDEDFNEYLSHTGKKRRLTSEQVRFLERSFEVENKLEPERKVRLAKELNLQPRQVAIWFQNRRARWKSKQLEKDYDVLQAQFDTLKANYDNLVREKESLKAEVDLLSDKLNLAEKEKGSPKLSDATEAFQASTQDPIVESFSETSPPKASTVSCNQERQSSAKTDFESESPHYTEMGHSSSYIFEHDYHSDISQDEEDNLTMSLLPPLKTFPKLEEEDDFIDLPANSCNLGELPVEDHAIWSWCF